jgi:hypothetical protein
MNDDLLDVSELADLRGESEAQLRESYAESLTGEMGINPGGDYVDGKLVDIAPMIPALPVLAETVANDFGLSPEDLCGGKRGKFISRAKRVFIERAHKHGYRLRDIATTLNCSPAAVTLLRQRKS